MAPEKRIVIHVGVHKTGSTSIQEFLRAHRTTLHELGTDFYLGVHFPSNHVELHTATMRVDRASPFKLDRDLRVDEAYRQQVKERVSTYVRNTTCQCVVFSAEGLSYLRYQDEMERLKAMFPEGRIEIVMYIRDARSFLASYRKEMKKHVMPEVIDKDSFAYTGEDSWLVDFDSRLSAFRGTFGAQNVRSLDYDEELRSARNIIPSFLRVLEIETYFQPQDWRGFFLNRTAVR